MKSTGAIQAQDKKKINKQSDVQTVIYFEDGQCNPQFLASSQMPGQK